MEKYSSEFKKRIIQAYNYGDGGQEYLAKNMGLLHQQISGSGLTHMRIE